MFKQRCIYPFVEGHIWLQFSVKLYGSGGEHVPWLKSNFNKFLLLAFSYKVLAYGDELLINVDFEVSVMIVFCSANQFPRMPKSWRHASLRRIFLLLTRIWVQLLSYMHDTELTILCYVNTANVIFFLYILALKWKLQFWDLKWKW